METRGSAERSQPTDLPGGHCTRSTQAGKETNTSTRAEPIPGEACVACVTYVAYGLMNKQAYEQTGLCTV